ncbi:IST1-like protein, partial [Cucurbita argyrosperma subsp. sororia]
MSMLASFFYKGFKAAQCKTLLKLTIPRIKLLRNRREIQLKQMRRDIAKLLETGQEATARIRVEHIIREENMMAAQEILELFCELIVVRLPIIETQRECPLDLKEAISSVCFAAPRCADLTELLQVQLLFAVKYGKEFVSAATELMPNCGVNRQLIELLSVRAPSPEKKLKLLKEIAEEHDVDWDPAGTEAEFNKSPEDLLNGSARFVSASKLPLPQEKHNEAYNAPQPDSDSELDMLDFPEVPKISVSPHSTIDPGSASSMIPPPSTSPPPETTHDSSKYSCIPKTPPEDLQLRRGEVTPVRSVSPSKDQMNISVGEDKQFLPFIAPPSRTPEEKFSFKPQFEPEINSPPPSVSRTPDEKFGLKYEQEIISPPPSGSRTKSDVSLNLQDVLAAAQAAVETAERAAAAARSAASLTKVRIDTLTMKTNDQDPEICCENPFHGATTSPPDHEQTFHLNQQDSIGHHHSSSMPYYSQDSFQEHHKESPGSDVSDHHRFESQKSGFDSSPGDSPSEHITIPHQPQRLPSMDDDPYFSYPNLFTSQNPNPGFDHSSADGS